MSWLTHALLEAAGVAHGFGTRACREPEGLVRARQVHGARVVVLTRDAAPPADPGAADALVSERPALPIGVVTADCVPILVATPAGRVAAVHAGWRGLAAGVIEAALAELAALEPEAPARAVAVIGPRIGPECYEVDAPVMDALAARHGEALDRAAAPTRAGHWQLDLAALARAALVRAGLADTRVAVLADACTACNAQRFHSHRRDGAGAGRLVHWIAARAPAPDCRPRLRP
ncbi:MAG TPA: laccase domain-containing protein [Sandaracinaceae bacterium]